MTMKIFNWMHRKLHPRADYSVVSYKKVFSDALIEDGEGKGETRAVACDCEGEKDTEGLLINHVLDGFLTIGTLGHGHLVLLPAILEEEEGSEEAPTALAVVQHNPSRALESKEERLVEEEKKRVELMAAGEEPMRPSCEILEPLLKDKPRTTLADLFAADVATFSRGSSGKKNPPVASCRTKGSKKLTKKGEDPPPAITKKLQRLMTRMVKKRIHPDVTNAAAAGEEGRLLPIRP